jgi:NADH-quinone oxidoreductase subunit G
MAEEIRGAQTNPSEADKAPKDSTAQQQGQKIIGEGQAAAQPNVGPAQAETAEKAAQPIDTRAREQTPLEKSDAAKVNADIEAAKAAGVEMISLVVDGVPVEVPKGTLVIEAAFRAGSDIPYFCYHPRLTSVGACRMCLASVELEMFGQRRASIMATCTVPASNGMVVKTATPDVKKAQNGILEFLLANHPLDCPICDRGGECPLQNMTIAYGPPTSRFVEDKRHFVKALPISDNVVLDRERCIQCMRCTRFTEEVAGDSQLSLLSRGATTEIGPFLGTDFNSNFSGNTIEICPVGALTSRSYRFKGRPWEVQSTDSICSQCGNGCNVSIGHRLGEIVRVNARLNEDINEEWTCDRGKFGQFYVQSDERLSTPLLRGAGGQFYPVSWDNALRTIAEKIQGTKAAYGPDALAAIGSTRATLEENYLLGKLFRGVIGTNQLDHQLQPYPLLPMQTSIAAIETFATIVSVGMDLPSDQPIVYLRVNKAVRKNQARWLRAATIDEALAATDAAGEGAVLLVPHHLGVDAIERARVSCAASGAKLNLLLPDCNSWGAPRAGVSPHLLPGGRPLDEGRAAVERVWGVTLPSGPGKTTAEIFSGSITGEIKFLYILGSDPATRYHDPARAKLALEKSAFTVVQELFLTETAKTADVVLPAASFAEKDGTFVNIEGREQALLQVIAPRGDSRPDWRILTDLMGRLGAPSAYFSARDITREYRKAAG